MSTEIDSVLSGIIILLLIVVIWKWYTKHSSCGQDYLKLSCGCMRGMCRCKGMSQTFMRRRSRPYSGGRLCRCGYPPNMCRCRYNKMMCSRTEGFDSTPNNENQGTSAGPLPSTETSVTQNYQEVINHMGVDDNVNTSHNEWCNSLTMHGLPTGASSCTTLEDTGRSHGTADFVGLTCNKWRKARQMATPDENARVVPSYESQEYYNTSTECLI